MFVAGRPLGEVRFLSIGTSPSRNPMCRAQSEDAVVNCRHEKSDAFKCHKPSHLPIEWTRIRVSEKNIRKGFLWQLLLIIAAALLMGARSNRSENGRMELEELASPGSIYIPGGGFAGFWYHFGYFSFQRMKASSLRHNESRGEIDIHPKNSTYYCYSSGCMAYIFAAVNLDIDTVLSSAQRAQQQWVDGQIHRYDVVPQFLQELLPSLPMRQTCEHCEGNQTVASSHPALPWDSILSRLRILVTVLERRTSRQWMRHRVHTPTCLATLIRHLQETTHIPWLTGPLLQNSSGEVIIDGGFSRTLHPPCRQKVAVPNNWLTVMHSFNPGMDPKHAKALYHHGMADAAKILS